MSAASTGRHPRRFRILVTGLLGLLLLASGCTRTSAPTEPDDPGEPVRGGTLNMLGSGDVDYMDPNISYYSIGYLGLRMWSRQLFTYPAESNKATTAAPDLATELPTEQNGGISPDGKTYTITIRDGANWNTSPNRQVTAAGPRTRREADLQPRPAVRRDTRLRRPDRGYPTFCAAFQGRPERRRDSDVRQQPTTSRVSRRRTTRRWCSG